MPVSTPLSWTCCNSCAATTTGHKHISQQRPLAGSAFYCMHDVSWDFPFNWGWISSLLFFRCCCCSCKSCWAITFSLWFQQVSSAAPEVAPASRHSIAPSLKAMVSWDSFSRFSVQTDHATTIRSMALAWNLKNRHTHAGMCFSMWPRFNSVMRLPTSSHESLMLAITPLKSTFIFLGPAGNLYQVRCKRSAEVSLS